MAWSSWRRLWAPGLLKISGLAGLLLAYWLARKALRRGFRRSKEALREVPEELREKLREDPKQDPEQECPAPEAPEAPEEDGPSHTVPIEVSPAANQVATGRPSLPETAEVHPSAPTGPRPEAAPEPGTSAAPAIDHSVARSAETSMPPAQTAQTAQERKVKAATERKKPSGMARGFFNKPPKKQPKKPEAETACGSNAPTVSKDPESKVASASSSAAQQIAREQEVGVTAFHNSSFREAKAAFERMRDVASAAGMGREEGQANRLLGNALDKLDAPEAEIEAAYQKAMKMAHEHDDMELSFNVLTGMGSHAVKAGDLQMAEHLYQQSLMLAQRVLTVQEQGTAEGNLGMCLGQMEGRHDECLDHFRKAMNLQRRDSNPHALVTLIANFGSVLCADGRYEEARKEYENGLTLARCIGDRRVEVNILTNLANLCENVLSLPQKARQYRAALKGEHSADACAICLEPLDQEGCAQTVLQCGHIHHSKCLDQVLSSDSQSRSKCPVCRNSLFCFSAA
mmetsp:Transcript_55563/g.100034  ORF Transcript_55563/g.100034 Transcript_55563/m.100034 type:complete len:514 (+) Transcript_55563:17-1558(+)